MKQYYTQSGDDSSDSEAPEEVTRPHKKHGNVEHDDDMPSSSGRSHSSSEAGSESDSDDDLDQQEQILEQRLADVPLEAVTKQLKDGKGPVGAVARAAAAAAKQQVFHRENKNRPQQRFQKKRFK